MARYAAVCYAGVMSDQRTITDKIVPGAVMSDDEIRRWRALPSAEQRRRFEEAILEAAASPRVEPDSPDDVFARVEARLRRS